MTDHKRTGPYFPSNGSEGEAFTDRLCDHCEREARFRETERGADSCVILSTALSEGAAAEWQYIDGRPGCTAYEPELSAEERERRAVIAAGQGDLFA